MPGAPLAEAPQQSLRRAVGRGAADGRGRLHRAAPGRTPARGRRVRPGHRGVRTVVVRTIAASSAWCRARPVRRPGARPGSRPPGQQIAR
ncbi:hypothetical protein SLNWT_5850 [Streptomyces albus]|uniref:Uncharacterized protein n=1 Tax=Streptomyces albus (strain ATCC 21838 / DSM 41398 / FERM P-419 / JCM 4703 / NBRC 107858) TaxID=1081613 RepID=A0A0B5F5P8_STRA4|nr:hypothetical protein SLNWT_5850 [Streptomyces albus]AOU80528.1 hypothetical protein SLNHY_5837 [Streptomyces albus]AYN36237.1 hypothetical protein DUI70_5743 [Streptomyces albus]